MSTHETQMLILLGVLYDLTARMTIDDISWFLENDAAIQYWMKDTNTLRVITDTMTHAVNSGKSVFP